jgi:hypothetical protein
MNIERRAVALLFCFRIMGFKHDFKINYKELGVGEIRI